MTKIHLNKRSHLLLYSDITRSSAVAQRPRALCVIEYFAKSLNITQAYSKMTLLSRACVSHE